MSSKKADKYKPKPARANATVRAARARAEQRRLEEVEQLAAAQRAEQRALREEREMQEKSEREEEEGETAVPGSGVELFIGLRDEEGWRGEEAASSDTTGSGIGTAGGQPSVISGLVLRPKNRSSPSELKAWEKRERERLRAHKKKIARHKRRKENRHLIRGMRNLRIAQRVAAGGDPDDEKEEDEDEENEIWLEHYGGGRIEEEDDENDDEDFAGGAGGQGVSQPVLAGH